MVKGVNKNIIEVNNTGSEIFERIVFYVSPKFSSLSSKSLKIASSEIEKTLMFSIDSADTLRNRIKYKKKIRNIIILSSAFLTLSGVAFLIIKLI